MLLMLIMMVSFFGHNNDASFLHVYIGVARDEKNLSEDQKRLKIR